MTEPTTPPIVPVLQIITKQTQIEQNLPDWFMDLFCDWDPQRQVWTVNRDKLNRSPPPPEDGRDRPRHK